METAVPAAGRVLCVMVHGLGGTVRDWDTWVEVLSSRFPEWSLKPLETLAGGARILGRAVDALASEAAEEIADAVNAQLAMLGSPSECLTVHFIGHSMGGIIIRGALPKLVDEVGVERVRLGHYISLSSPHLGVQAPWSTPRHAWKNLSRLTQPVSLQLAQLSVQDARGKRRRPYLVALSDPAGPHLAQLRRFRTRTCVTMARGDALIPLASGLIEPGHQLFQWHAFSSEGSFWRLEDVSERSGGSTSGVVSSPSSVGGLAKTPLAEGLASDLEASESSRGSRRRARKGGQPSGFFSCFGAVDRSLAEAPRRCGAGGAAVVPPVRHQGSSDSGSSSDSDSSLRPRSLAAKIGSPAGIPTPTRAADAARVEGEDEAGASESDGRTPPAAFGCLSMGGLPPAPPEAGPRHAPLQWRCSASGACRFPGQIFHGLDELQWRRVAVEMHHRPFAKNAHVFLIGKRAEQFEREHRMSRELVYTNFN